MSAATKGAASGQVPQLLTVGEVARQLGQAASALYTDRNKGVYRIVPVDAYVVFGRSLRIRADRLAEHIRNCTTPAAEAAPVRFRRDGLWCVIRGRHCR